ncbi:diacylglycerol kinase family protein [Conexibacter sp. SYSU D00693]|uniref:diacylglycerol/lipid kinase family protein n=1 Tax=Conexibacter sp. SYSU D00693 TaxID=2812560 RepID=UPI00196ACAF3|nr:diacylglycerol kinase family protein [Conexibacter sp. SYSU D00693]
MSAPPTESLERLGDAFALTDPSERKRMLVIVNPYATTVSDRLKTLVVAALGGRYAVDAIDTEGRDHATALCREARDEGYDVVVAFGGDGTVNEAANGLAGSSTPLTTLPGGATNVFCKMLGIPGDIVDATEHLLRIADDWQPRRVDLATVNGRRFTFSCGVGLDASVVRRVDSRPRLKSKLGAWYFTYAAVTTFLREYTVRPPRLEAEFADGGRSSGVTAIVQNGDPFTYFNDFPLHVAEGVELDDGQVGGILLRTTRPTAIPTVAFRLFSRRAAVVDHRHIEPFGPVDGLVVRSTDGRPVPVEVDGDWIGDVTEARFGVEPGALTVVA